MSISIVVDDERTSVCVLKGRAELENFQFFLSAGHKSLLRETRKACEMFRTHMPIQLLNAINDFLEKKCNQYDWFQFCLREDDWAARFEEDKIIYNVIFDGANLDIEPSQVIID